MSLARCGRLARLSLGSIRPTVAVSPRAFVPRAPLARAVSSSSRDGQQKVRQCAMGIPLVENGRLTPAAASRCVSRGL